MPKNLTEAEAEKRRAKVERQVEAAKAKVAEHGWRITEVKHDLPDGDGSKPFEGGQEYTEPGWNVYATADRPNVWLDVRGVSSLTKALAEIVTRVEAMEAAGRPAMTWRELEEWAEWNGMRVISGMADNWARGHATLVLSVANTERVWVRELYVADYATEAAAKRALCGAVARIREAV